MCNHLQHKNLCSLASMISFAQPANNRISFQCHKYRSTLNHMRIKFTFRVMTAYCNSLYITTSLSSLKKNLILTNLCCQQPICLIYTQTVTSLVKYFNFPNSNFNISRTNFCQNSQQFWNGRARMHHTKYQYQSHLYFHSASSVSKSWLRNHSLSNVKNATTKKYVRLVLPLVLVLFFSVLTTTNI
jgi:hypothetical protein